MDNYFDGYAKAVKLDDRKRLLKEGYEKQLDPTQPPAEALRVYLDSMASNAMVLVAFLLQASETPIPLRRLIGLDLFLCVEICMESVEEVLRERADQEIPAQFREAVKALGMLVSRMKSEVKGHQSAQSIVFLLAAVALILSWYWSKEPPQFGNLPAAFLNWCYHRSFPLLVESWSVDGNVTAALLNLRCELQAM